MSVGTASSGDLPIARFLETCLARLPGSYQAEMDPSIPDILSGLPPSRPARQLRRPGQGHRSWEPRVIHSSERVRKSSWRGDARSGQEPQIALYSAPARVWWAFCRLSPGGTKHPKPERSPAGAQVHRGCGLQTVSEFLRTIGDSCSREQACLANVCYFRVVCNSYG